MVTYQVACPNIFPAAYGLAQSLCFKQSLVHGKMSNNGHGVQDLRLLVRARPAMLENIGLATVGQLGGFSPMA